MEMVVCQLVTPDQKGSRNESQEVALSSSKWTPVVSLNLMITLLSSSVSEATMHFSHLYLLKTMGCQCCLTNISSVLRISLKKNNSVHAWDLEFNPSVRCQAKFCFFDNDKIDHHLFGRKLFRAQSWLPIIIWVFPPLKSIAGFLSIWFKIHLVSMFLVILKILLS